MPFVTTSDKVRLHYADEGAGHPTIVLIGGWTMSAEWWRRQRPVLARKHRVISLDMRAYGESEKPHHGHRLARHAKDLHDVLAALAIDDAVPVGWSMGAATLLSYYDLFGPERLAGMVFVDQTPKMLNEAGWTLGMPKLTRATVADLLAGVSTDRHAHASGFPARMLAETPRGEDLAWMVPEILKCPTETAVALLADLSNQDYRDVVPTIQLPLLVLTGRKSRIFPCESSLWIADNAPNGEAVVFEDSDHCPFYEEPEKFNDAVLRFAAKLGR